MVFDINADFTFDYDCLIFLTESTVYKEMRKIPSKTYCGPDNIPPLLLRKCALSLAKPIAFILRYSYLYSTIPDLWKYATIISLYKGKGLDKASLSSYRPVSLTSAVAKLAEKFIYDLLKPYLEST